MGGKKLDYQSEYEKYSLRADRWARLILVGLTVEIAAVFILGRPWSEACFTILSTLLIFLGVWGELRYSKRAKEAGDRIVADAEARAAEALAKAEEERTRREAIEAEVLSKPLAALNNRDFVKEMSAFNGVSADVVVSGDTISVRSIAQILCATLWGAGWKIGGGVIRLGPAFVSVQIVTKPGADDATWAAAIALSNAVHAAGIRAIHLRGESGVVDWSKPVALLDDQTIQPDNAAPIRITVGSK